MASGKVYYECSYCQKKHDTKLAKCAGCLLNFYCDKECQKLHWKTHKTECKGVGDNLRVANTKIAKRMTKLLYFVNSKVSNLWIREKKNHRICFQYVGKNFVPSDEELIKGMNDAVEYLEFSEAQVVIAGPGQQSKLPEPSSIMQVTLLPLDSAESFEFRSWIGKKSTSVSVKVKLEKK